MEETKELKDHSDEENYFQHYFDSPMKQRLSADEIEINEYEIISEDKTSEILLWAPMETPEGDIVYLNK